MGGNLSVAGRCALLVGFAAGGGTDLVARLTGQWIGERLGQAFVVENRTGAGSNIATEMVVSAPADGYMLLLANTANTVNVSLYKGLGFEFTHDIAPVGAAFALAQPDAGSSFLSSQNPFPSSSPMPRPILARSIWGPAAMADRSIWPAHCSR